jgi:ribonuclease P protein component
VRDRGQYALRRSVSLKRRAWIRPLFDRSQSDVMRVSSGCVRLLFRLIARPASSSEPSLAVGFATARGIETAVRRNRAKRLLRESFRLNQDLLHDRVPENMTLTMMILYRYRDLRSFAEVHSDLQSALRAARDKLDEAVSHG